ncbi:MAG: hypothetical protein V4636_13150 [Pseudomonadota bacterium]
MDALISQLGVAGIVVAVLIAGLRWISNRYEAMDVKLDAAAKACAERESALITRVQSLEDSRNSNLTGIVDATLESLRLSAAALNSNSGAFQAMIETGRTVRATKPSKSKALQRIRKPRVEQT